MHCKKRFVDLKFSKLVAFMNYVENELCVIIKIRLNKCNKWTNCLSSVCIRQNPFSVYSVKILNHISIFFSIDHSVIDVNYITFNINIFTASEFCIFFIC